MIVARHTAVRSSRAAKRAGFTLMEVMVVAAILVILAGVGSVALFRYLEDAKENTARVQIATVEKAVLSYQNSHGGQFPPTLEVLCAVEGGKSAYLEEKDIHDPWGNVFGYSPQERSPTGKPKIYVAQPPSGTPISNW
jgi:general secretion pathway protein G